MINEQWKHWYAEVLETIESIQFRTDPFYHFYCEPFLPPAMFELLNQYWPNDDCFWGQNDIAETPLSHKEANLRKVVIIDDTPGFAEQPDAVEFWKNFRELIRGPILLNAIIDKSVKYISEVRTDLNLQNVQCWSNALLEVDTDGFRLGPHVDSCHCLISLLLYLPQKGSDEEQGTSVFQPKKEFLAKNPGLVNEFTVDYFDNDDFDETFRAPYKPNGLFGIVNEPKAFHGVQELKQLKTGRRHMLWSITNKEDNPFPSALERVKKGIAPEKQRTQNRLGDLMANKFE